MKESRYLVRIAHSNFYHPIDQERLLTKVRELSVPYRGKAINLRISSLAIEFDLFFAPEIDPSIFKSVLLPLGDIVTYKRLDVPPAPVAAQDIVREARQLFNEYRFWEVHEVLEELWKKLSGSEKQLVQGLILIAASFVHAQKDEQPVMWNMLADALKRLEGQPPDYYGWNIQQLRATLTQALLSKTLAIPRV